MSLLLMLVLLLASSRGDGFCRNHHVCLRRDTIDTRGLESLAADTEKEDDHGLGPVLLFSSHGYDYGNHGVCNAAGATRYNKLTKHVIVKFSGTGRSGSYVRSKLEALGCAVLQYLPRYSFSVFLPDLSLLQEVNAIEGVTWIGHYKPRYKVTPEWSLFARGEAHEQASRDSSGRTLAIVLVPRAGFLLLEDDTKKCELIVDVLAKLWEQRLNQQFSRIGVKRLGVDSLEVAIPSEFMDAVLRWLSRQEWASWISPVFKAHVGNLFSSAMQQSGTSVGLEKGAPFLPARPLWSMGIMGEGQIIGIGDSGVDLNSCYFRDEHVETPGYDHRKVVSYRVMGGGDTIDSYGHGSHVAGSIAGHCLESLFDYSVQSEKYNGMAPHARIAVTDIGLGKNTYVTPPLDLGNYYWQAYNTGARIHSDSWTTWDPSYNLMSRSVDLFTFNNPLFLPIFAAGNAGSSHTSGGTITSPAISKNSLAVGATLGAASVVVDAGDQTIRAAFIIHLQGNGTQTLLQNILERSYGPTFSDHWETLELVQAIPENACTSLHNPDAVRGKLVLANREDCPCMTKFFAAQEARGRGVLVYNNDSSGLFEMGLPSHFVTIPAASLSKAFGLILREMLSEGHQIMVQPLKYYVPEESPFESMASFSSWGPAVDGRFKPDIVAPGDKITSARGSTDAQRRTCETQVLSGTSMAAPIMAGGAALVRQYFVEGFYPTGSRVLEHAFEPSGALLKAVIINGAMPLRGLNGLGVTIDPPPSTNQGYGRADLANSIFLPGHNIFQVTALDGDPLKTGEGQRYCFLCCSGSGDMKFTLVWTDPPASPAASLSLVNDLDMKVTDPNGTLFFGNAGLSNDRLNNVEQMVVSDPTAGLYVVDVSAYHVPETGPEGQAFAFVARGPFTESPCLVIEPLSFPPAIGNSKNVNITLQGASGQSIRWYCSLNASIQSSESHYYRLCGSFEGALLSEATLVYSYGELPDATYVFSARAVDYRYINQAASSESSISFTIDTEPPDTTINHSSACIYCTTASFEFSSNSQDDDHFECQISTNHSNFDWVLCASPWTISVAADGNYAFHVRAVDLAGNVDPSPATLEWLVHTNRPRAVILNIFPEGAVINNATCTFEFGLDFPGLPGKGPPNWSCRLDSVASLTGLGGWQACSSPMELTLPEGTSVFSVRAVSEDGEAGLSSLPATLTLRIDRTPPEVVLCATPPALSSSINATFLFESSEVASTYRCCLVEANKLEGTDCWQFCESPSFYSELEDGLHQFWVQATDTAGNNGSIAKYTFLVDTTAPNVSELRISQDDPEHISAEFELADWPVGSGISSIFCCLQPSGQAACGTWIPCSSPWNVSKSRLFVGEAYVVKVKVEDNVFNVGEQQAELVLLNDGSEKDDLVVLPVCPSPVSHHRDVTLLITSRNNSTDLECDLDEKPTECKSPFEVEDLADGLHVLKVRRRGTTGGVGCSWFIDTTSPTTYIETSPLSFLETVSPSFNITGSDRSSSVERLECLLQSLDSGGFARNWTQCNPRVTLGALPTSLYCFSARSVDVAGNVDEQPARSIFLVNYWLVVLNRLSQLNLRGVSNYHICGSTGPCTFLLVPNVTIAASVDAATIAVIGKVSSANTTTYVLDSSPYTMVMADNFHGRLCSPVSNVSSLSTSNREAEHIVLMLRFRTSDAATIPLVLVADKLQLEKGNLYAVYTNKSVIMSTTPWEIVSSLIRDDYATVNEARMGSYMIIELKDSEVKPVLLTMQDHRLLTRYQWPNWRAFLSGVLMALAGVTTLNILMNG